ncbi:tRNA 2-thiouridine(34) synthase MnmA, partial [Candidatus Saccharibacteria bacterium]|nr:tRNA 2-thiouridine(34) synthase MnmA [Candidatus Saccharibacteria bacterium]
QGSRLMRAANQDKDQTYFLYRITGEAVAQTIFPLGSYQTKAEVRADAERLGLSTAGKPDSQGICFVGTVNMRDFLRQYIRTEPGEIIDQETGRHVGEHDGAIFYTLGQRHGLNVGGGLPYYVVGKDMGRNIVYVSRRLDSEVFWRNELTLSQLSWINEAPVATGDYLVRVRHRAPLKVASVRWRDSDRLVVALKEPERAVASGQSVVIYDDQVCLGGGVVC